MSYFNSKGTAYSKLEDPPAYDGRPSNNNTTLSVTKIPMVPETARSRFEEQIYPVYYYNNQDYFETQDLNDPPKTTTTFNRQRSNYCRLLGNISLIIGIALMVFAVLFKVQSRSHISQAIEKECPANCVTGCYDDLPFYHPSTLCDTGFKAKCDSSCNTVGIDTANTCAILFLVFVSVGGLLVVIQIVNSCLGYCCYDYFVYKNQSNNNLGGSQGRV